MKINTFEFNNTPKLNKS